MDSGEQLVPIWLFYAGGAIGILTSYIGIKHGWKGSFMKSTWLRGKGPFDIFMTRLFSSILFGAIFFCLGGLAGASLLDYFFLEKTIFLR
jgi:hypothetical protein